MKKQIEEKDREIQAFQDEQEHFVKALENVHLKI